MSTLGERKCALLLATLRKSEQRWLLARLPKASAASIRKLTVELQSLRVPIAALASDVLADEVQGLTARTSLDLDQLIDLSERLSSAWFSRVLSVWTSVDRDFCLATLDKNVARQVRRELGGLKPLPTKLVEALRAEAVRLAPTKAEAA